jgi:hypothetical protein
MITFGAGSPQYSTALPASFGFRTSYSQTTSGAIHDGSFGIVNSVPGDFGSWLAGGHDHTGDSGGYMFIVNADYNPDRVFNYTIDNLCVGTKYQLSAFVANLNRKGSNLILPAVSFEVHATSAGNPVIATRSTGNIPEPANMAWNQYGLTFVAPARSVLLLMISDALGGVGNDFAVDDIELRTCSANARATCPAG